jgi:hypothetical protein
MGDGRADAVCCIIDLLPMKEKEKELLRIQDRADQRKTNLQFLEVTGFVVHLNLERVDFEELGSAL